VGDQVGYLFGKKVGPRVVHAPDSRFFKQQNVQKAHDFIEKYGPKTIRHGALRADRPHVSRRSSPASAR
jgi:membrane protein DedA with SNARE-associated domain